MRQNQSGKEHVEVLKHIQNWLRPVLKLLDRVSHIGTNLVKSQHIDWMNGSDCIVSVKL